MTPSPGRGKSFGLGPAILAKLTLSQCDLRRNRNLISTATITMNKGVPTLRLDIYIKASHSARKK
jgi:hypothetical protein